MPPPGEGKLRVSIEALRKDAAVWDDSGDIMRSAAQVAARLDLAALHFSYVGDKVGLVELYQQLQDRLIRLLSQGSETCETVATSLRNAADGYERDEADAVHRLNNIY
ncbi:hypothetical protein [Micromonospora endolithica]|uniref:ESX-1 secretion-associated protein n=1 Tax=Micromonospora endolithica TaxID=230091 RepID=A0A3A9Z7W1_9ACTN|nr:hypothetical protein [Micromonospora endolithica]RKN44318.1 hypothetical protein D7223_18810 [Micromonospora endolithica]TWJ25798.1 hypothetical protein JD76_05972 [Micromonospora endolithica]